MRKSHQPGASWLFLDESRTISDRQRLGAAIGSKVGRIEGRRKVNLLNFSHEISEVPFHLHPRVASLGYIDSFSSTNLLFFPFSLCFLSLSISLFLSHTHIHTHSLTVLFFLSFVARLYLTAVNVRPNVSISASLCNEQWDKFLREKKKKKKENALDLFEPSISRYRYVRIFSISWNNVLSIMLRILLTCITRRQPGCSNDVLVKLWN